MAPDLLKQEGRVPLLPRSLLPDPWQPGLHGYGIRQVAVTGRAASEAPGCGWWCWFDDWQFATLRKEHGARLAAVPNGFFVITDSQTGKDFPHCREIHLGAETVAARSPGRLDCRARSRAVWRTWIGTFRSHSD